MKLGMIGLGRMGANMVRRITCAGHECVVYDVSDEAVAALAKEGACGAASIEDFIAKLKPPRNVWLMLPTAFVDSTLAKLVPHAWPATIRSSTAAIPTTTTTSAAPPN